MKIESVEVIPMRKESIWEDVENDFEVAFITTDYVKWFTETAEGRAYFTESPNTKFTDECREFAKKQKAFMTSPTGIFGDNLYVAATKSVDSLEGIRIQGPLYTVFAVEIDDTSKEKTEVRNYVDPVSFNQVYGHWYPTKTVYKIRYGVKTK